MNRLDGKLICLDLSNSTPYKEKKNLIDLLTRNGAKVSLILKKDVSLVVKNDKNEADSYKCRNAFKLGIPVVGSDYIIKLLNNEIVDIKEFIISNSTNKENFKQGKIATSE